MSENTGRNDEVSTKCRICESPLLDKVMDLGFQPLSGVFQDRISDEAQLFPLVLFVCGRCNLVQLGESVTLEKMYGESYGYRSGLNPTMITHLAEVASEITSRIDLGNEPGTVLDIGSNDGTFLRNFDPNVFRRVGIDPSAKKFLEFYDPGVNVIVDFFSEKAYAERELSRPNLVTSIAMFYDLENPMRFAQEIHNLLIEGGYWYLEVCYGPWVAGVGAFDTICHEHLEYYSLGNLDHIFREIGFRVIHTSVSNSNGVSVGLLVRKFDSANKEILVHENVFEWLLHVEKMNELNSISTWKNSSELVLNKKDELLKILSEIKLSGKSIYGMGASTKGNVLLNYLEINAQTITAIGEVNTSKFGKFMPGSGIPIIPEDEVLEAMPDYILFLPWHFREFAINKYANYLDMGGKLIFPLPDLEIYPA